MLFMSVYFRRQRQVFIQIQRSCRYRSRNNLLRKRKQELTTDNFVQRSRPFTKTTIPPIRCDKINITAYNYTASLDLHGARADAASYITIRRGMNIGGDNDMELLPQGAVVRCIRSSSDLSI